MLVEHDFDAIRSEDLDRSGEGWLREGMGVTREEEGAKRVLAGAIFHNRLSDGSDVIVIEGRSECAAAMARGAECNPLCGNGGIWMKRVVGSDEAWNVDQ